MEKIKSKVSEVFQASKNVTISVSEFVNGLCLLAVSVFSINEALEHRDSLWYKGLFVAGAVIALQGLSLLARHFNSVKR